MPSKKVTVGLLTSVFSLVAGTANPPATEKVADAKNEKPGGRCCTVLPKNKIEQPVFLRQDPAKKLAELFLIATFDKSNYGMNFNGLSKSEGGYEVPFGWKIKVTFCNNSAVPHSVMVVEEDAAARKINLGAEPYFEGAATPKPNTLGTIDKVETFEFTADEAGDFSLACGFPTHSANGHRIFLKIKKDLEKAAFITPEEDEKASE
jgi:hypothetical protein